MTRAAASFDRPTIEVADILRRYGEAYLRDHAGHVGRTERRVMSAITACRTAALGCHVEACDDRGATRIAYNSCRNRHCPKCQGGARVHWLADRPAELLPVPNFHVVFTMPAPIAAIAFQNKGAVYAILFKTPVEAMTALAANPRRLGADWRPRHSAHLGAGVDAPSSGSLRRARRWAFAQWLSMDQRARELLSGRQAAFAVVPPPVRSAPRRSYLPSIAATPVASLPREVERPSCRMTSGGTKAGQRVVARVHRPRFCSDVQFPFEGPT
jgi:hypothetical protein